MDSGIPLAEKAIRTAAVYAALLVLLRVAGKRDLAQFNTFDLVVMLLLANVVQNAIIGPDYSLIGGLVGAAVLIAGDSALVWAATRWSWVHRLFEGEGSVLAEDGHVDRAAMRRLGVRRADIAAAVRKQGGGGIGDVSRVSLEPGGIVVVRLKPERMAATRGDIDRIAERLAAIERRLPPATPPEPAG